VQAANCAIGFALFGIAALVNCVFAGAFYHFIAAKNFIKADITPPPSLQTSIDDVACRYTCTLQSQP
jgi:hypothetical protein